MLVRFIPLNDENTSMSPFYLPLLNWKCLCSCSKVRYWMRFELVCCVRNGINTPAGVHFSGLCAGEACYVGKWLVILSNKNEQITWKGPSLREQKSDLCLTLRSVHWREKFPNRQNKLQAKEKAKKIAYFLITLFKPTSSLVYNPLWEHIRKGQLKVCLEQGKIMK